MCCVYIMIACFTATVYWQMESESQGCVWLQSTVSNQVLGEKSGNTPWGKECHDRPADNWPALAKWPAYSRTHDSSENMKWKALLPSKNCFKINEVGRSEKENLPGKQSHQGLTRKQLFLSSSLLLWFFLSEEQNSSVILPSEEDTTKWKSINQ